MSPRRARPATSVAPAASSARAGRPPRPASTKPASRIREPEIERLDREAFISVYLLAGRLSGEVEAICREEEIAMSHYTMLWFLSRHQAPDGVPMGSLVDGHLNRAADATRLADRLAALGFIERSSSSTDRRVVLVKITRVGREVFLRLTRRIKRLHRGQFGGLAHDELRELRRLAGKLLLGGDANVEAIHPLAGR